MNKNSQSKIPPRKLKELVLDDARNKGYKSFQDDFSAFFSTRRGNQSNLIKKIKPLFKVYVPRNISVSPAPFKVSSPKLPILNKHKQRKYSPLTSDQFKNILKKHRFTLRTSENTQDS